MSCCAHRNILIYLVGLVHGDSSGAGGSSCCGRGGHSSRLPPCRGSGSGSSGNLWGGPWCLVMPRRSLSFLARPGGLPFPVGCLVLSVWPQRAFLSCHVLSYLSSPGGLLIPPNYLREFFWGVERFRLEDHLPWPPELPAPPWPPSFVLLWRSPSCGPVRVCPEGPSERPPPPSPVELLRRGTHLPGRGSYVRVLLCVSCVPASCVHIWFVSCPC